jgi:hypothetical protein
MFHVINIAQILIDECGELEKRAAPALSDGKGVSFPQKFLGYPQAIVSSLEIDVKSVGDNPMGYPVTSKVFVAEFEILIRFDSNVTLDFELIDEVNDKIKNNILLIDRTISSIVRTLQARKIRLLGNDAYCDITNIYILPQLAGNGTKSELLYAVQGTLTYKTNYNYQVIRDNQSQRNGVLLDGVHIKENFK